MMRSLRRDLIVRTVLSAAAVLTVSGVLLYAFVRAGLNGELDRELVDRVRLLASTLDQSPRGVEIDFEGANLPGSDRIDTGGLLQVWSSAGAVLYRSRPLGSADLQPVDGSLDSPGLQSITLPDGRPGRAVGVSFTPRRDGEEDDGADGGTARPPGLPLQSVHMVLARHTRSIDAVLDRLSVLLTSVGLLAVVVCSGVLWFAVRSSLRPLEDLAGQIGRLDEQDLTSRVTPSPPVRELQPVSDRLNELLERLEGAFLRERAFSADVAHELRTPLAGLRSVLEVALSRERRREQYRQALGDSLAIAERMDEMVERLLALARLDAGQVTVHAEQCDLKELMEAAWGPFAAKARERGLSVQRDVEGETLVTTDPVLLGRALTNVFSNAVEYADGGGQVRIGVLDGNNEVEVHVANGCAALTPEETENALKRFWRRDMARAAEGDHCGLGLPVAERIMVTLGGGLRVRSGGDVGFEVTLNLPKQPPVAD
jgi:two-component system heavy metal sensor histidine kinase CusS